MMSKTHLTVGVAAALAVTMPTTLSGLFAAGIGGAAGGILCDIECRSKPRMWDAPCGRWIAFGLSVILFAADWFLKAGLCQSILLQDSMSLTLGGFILLITCLIGRMSPHRTFTHSLLYAALLTFGFWKITPLLAVPVLAGAISHLAIDTLNKKPIPWLFPFFRPGFCLKLCYSDRFANKLLMFLGLTASIALAVICLINMGIIPIGA